MRMFELDFRSRQPLYDQLYHTIIQMAALGALDSGEPLPSVRILARELGINPNTVQKAYQMLERDGILNTVPGKGSFLSSSGIAMEQQRKKALEKLKEALVSAADCGVSRKEAEKLANEIFSGRDQK